MKIKELLELTKESTLATIAKEQLTVGEKKAREALKNAGCYNMSGKKGWFFDGEQEVLEESIYNYVTTSKPKANSATISDTSVKPSTKPSTTNSTDKSTTNSVKASEKLATSKQVASKNSDSLGAIGTVTNLDNIDLLLKHNEELDSSRTYRGFYWDKEVIDFLASVKHGNKSDLMNEIVKTVLRAKGLLK